MSVRRERRRAEELRARIEVAELEERLEARSNPITFQDVWGSGAQDFGTITVDKAVSLVPVYGATRLIADQIASLPIKAYRQTGRDDHEPADLPSLFKDPTIFGTPYEWIHRACTSLLLRGNAFGMVTGRNFEGTPTGIEWLDPSSVGVDDNRSLERPRFRVNGQLVTEARYGGPLVHVPGYTLPGLVLGLSAIKAFAVTMDLGHAVVDFGRDWFKGGSVPAGVLTSEGTVNEDQAKTTKARFKEAVRGREPVVLGSSVKYEKITVPPDESQFIQTMRFNATQIATIFGVPPEKIGGESGKSMTYQNLEQESLDFVAYALRPYCTKLEAAFAELLPRPQFVRFDFDALVRADLSTRYKAHQIALGVGGGVAFKTVEEVRREEELSPPKMPRPPAPVVPPPTRVPELPSVRPTDGAASNNGNGTPAPAPAGQ